MADVILDNLVRDVQLAEDRFKAGEIRLDGLEPFDRALLGHVDRLKSWDVPSTGTSAGKTIARANARRHDREIRPAAHRRSFIPGAADAPTLGRR